MGKNKEESHPYNGFNLSVRDLAFGHRLQHHQLVATQSKKENYKMQPF